MNNNNANENGRSIGTRSNISRKRELAKIKELTGWTVAELAAKLDRTEVIVKSWLKGTETLLLADLLDVQPDELATTLLSDRDNAVTKLAEKTGVTLSASAARLTRYANRAGLSDEREITVGDRKKLSKDAPPEDVIDLARAAVADYAWDVIAKLSPLFRDDDWKKADLYTVIDRQLQGYVMVHGMPLQGLLMLTINGMPRRINGERLHPSFGIIAFNFEGNGDTHEYDLVKQAAWEKYEAFVTSPATAEDVELYGMLLRIFSFRHQDIADWSGASREDARRWAQRWVPEVDSTARVEAPPTELLEMLAIRGLNWATTIVTNAFGDTHFRRSPLVVSPIQSAVERKKIADRNQGLIGSIQTLRSDPKKVRGRSRKKGVTT